MDQAHHIANHWWWLSLALILAIAEMVVPGVFMIWLGGAALLTGLITLAFGIAPAAQFGVAAVASIAAVYAGRKFIADNPIVSDDPALNDRLARLIGQQVVVSQAIIAGSGRVKVGDGEWPATGPDMAVGDRGRVSGAQGAVLVVEPV